MGCRAQVLRDALSAPHPSTDSDDATAVRRAKQCYAHCMDLAEDCRRKTDGE